MYIRSSFTLRNETTKYTIIMKKYTLLLCSAILTCINTLAQTITGEIADAQQQPLAYSNIVLQTTDSTFVAGTVTSEKGSFKLEKIQQGDYRLVISNIGYYTLYIDLQGFSRTVDMGRITMEEMSKQLGEVTVTASSMISRADRKLVFPNKKQVEASNNSTDLLRNLMLPRINVNPMDGSVVLTDGSSVQLCINGRKVGKEEINALLPEDIIRVEYLEDPGLRYGDAGAVVNYIVRRYELGGSFSIQGKQAPHIVWGEYNMSGKVNYKKSEFGIWYGAQPHKFKKIWRTNEETFLKEDGTTLHRTEDGIPDGTQEYMQWGGISYNLQEADNYMLNASIGFWNENRPGTGFRSILYTREYPDLATERIDKSHNRTTRPVFDLYFQKQLKNKQFLALNAVGTYIQSHNRQTYQEILDNEPVADYFSGVQGDKYSIIAEGIYEKEFRTGRLSAGVKHTQAYTDNIYDGTLQYSTQMKQADTYAYLQYSGKWKKLNYMAGAGVTRSWFQQIGEEDYETFRFNPRFSLSYTFSKEFYARLNGSLDSEEPSLSQLSAVDQLIDSLQIRRGNPTLRPYNTYRLSLTTGYNKGKVQIGLYSRYRNSPDIIMEQTYCENNKFIRSYANHHKFQSWENELSVRVGMLWNILQLSANTGFNRYWSDGVDYMHTYSNLYYQLEAMAMYKKFMAYFMIQNNRNRFFGESLTSGENLHVLMLQYRLGKANVGLGCINPFADNYKREQENRNRFAGSKGAWFAKESAHMFFFTFSYNCSFGRDYKSNSKKIQNQDTDAGVL